jgi:hypothetical protein
LEESLQVFVGGRIFADTSALKQLEEVLGSNDFDRILLGLGFYQLLVNGSIEEIIETYVQLH